MGGGRTPPPSTPKTPPPNTPTQPGGGLQNGMTQQGLNSSPTKQPILDTVKIKCWYAKELQTTNIREILEGTKVASDAKVEEKNHTVTTKYGGKLNEVVVLEGAAGNAGMPSALISHARMIVMFRPQKGADVEKLKSALTGVKGVKAAEVCKEDACGAEVFADLEVLSIDDLKSACEGAGFKADCKTHEWVELSIKADEGTTSEGRYNQLEKELNIKQGVILFSLDGANRKVTAVTLKRVSDDSFKSLSIKAGVTFEKITRKS